jgi:ABC-2 type transport system permease protein
MLANVFTKTILERWKGWMIAAVSLAALFFLAMSVYQDIDLGVYTNLPEVYRSLIGISQEADVGSLAINALIGSYGAMSIAAMALAMGASSIAGEERQGTIGLLLGNPKSRTSVLVSKAAAMVVLTTLIVLALWGVIVLAAETMGVSIEGMHVGALSLHLLLSSLFYGFLAMFIGAWIGSRGAALGVSIGTMVVSFFAAGILPLVEGAEDFVKAFPWHYFTGSKPLLNGVDWGHIGVLAAACAAFAAGSVIGVNRRDLKGQSVGATLLDRLRANPVTEKVVGRLAGSARTSSIWIKTASEYQVHLVITAASMFLVMGVLMGPMYAAIPAETFEAFANFPETMLALFGGGDIATPEGWYQLETFGMMAPIAVMVVAIAIGAGALAGEEASRTMGLLLANPIRRSKIVLEKGWTMVFYSFLVGFATFTGVTLGSILGDMGMDVGNIAATCLLQSLVGLVFGALALALSAGTGQKSVAVFGAVGAGIVMHLFNSLASLNEAIAGWAKWSPFYYYLGNDPLNNGMDWSNAAILTGLSIVLVGLSAVLFKRRDIR